MYLRFLVTAAIVAVWAGRAFAIPHVARWIGEVDGAATPVFSLDKRTDEPAWYEIKFMTTNGTNANWMVTTFAADSRCIAEQGGQVVRIVSGGVYGAVAPWLGKIVVVAAEPEAAKMRFAVSAPTGTRLKNVTVRRIDLQEAAAWCRSRKPAAFVDIAKMVMNSKQGTDELAAKGDVSDAIAPKTTETVTAALAAIPEGERVVLENARTRVVFDNYRVREIFDKARRVSVARAGKEVYPFLALKWKKGTGFAQPYIHPATEAKAARPVRGGTAQEPTLDFAFTYSNGVVARPRVKLNGKGELEWTLAITTVGDCEICEVDYPRISGIAIGENVVDDFCYCDGDWRQIWQNSSARAGGKRPTASRCTILWDESAALYLGMEDPEQYDWWIWAGHDGFRRAQAGFNIHPRIISAKPWTGNGIVWRLALTDGGSWIPAARIARAYNAKALLRPDVPNHVKWLVDATVYPNSNLYPRLGWDTLNCETHERWSERTFGTNDNWYAEIPLASGNRQMLDGPCAAYCGMHPYLSPVWGSIREYGEKLKVLRGHGQFYNGYINANLYGVAYPRHKRIGAFARSLLPAGIPDIDEAFLDKTEMVEYDGEPYAHWNYPDGQDYREDWFAEFPCSPMTQEWHDWLMYWFVKNVEWGMDGVYIDQLNMAYENGRYSPRYPGAYGAWLRSQRDFLKEMRVKTRKINPYVSYTGEVANEITGQYLDMSLTSGVFDNHNIVQFTHPRAIMWNGTANGGRADLKRRFAWQCAARFEQGITGFRNYLDLRRRVKSFLYDADFMDADSLICRHGGSVVKERFPLTEKGGNLIYPLNAGITAKWFLFSEGEQRGAVINVINWDEKGKKPFKDVTVEFPVEELGAVKAAYVFTLCGRVEKVNVKEECEGRKVVIPVPECEATSIVLSNGKLRPLVDWRHGQVLTGGSKGKVTLKITNVNEAPMDVGVSLRLPEGWVAARLESAPYRIAPGETKEVVAEYAVAKNAAPGRYDLWADVTSQPSTSDLQPSTFSAYNVACVSERFIMDLRGEHGSFRVWFKNISDEPISGVLSAEGRNGLVSMVAKDKVTLAPHSVLEVPLEVKGLEALSEYSEIEATFRVGGIWPFRKKVSRVKRVMPIVPNHDFEIDHAGDMKPDWWMSRSGPVSNWSYECMNLSTNAHSGKYAIELKTCGVFTRNINASPTCFNMKKGATYRLALWSKAETNAQASVIFAGNVINIAPSDEWKLLSQTVKAIDNRSPLTLRTNGGRLLVDDIRVEEVK